MYSFTLQNLIEKLQVLPSVGPKTAEQYAFALKELDAKERNELAKAIEELARLKLCSLCGKICARPKETGGKILCEICADQKRDSTLLMVVESEPDLESIEKTGRYQGLYYILGQTNEKNIKRLLKRIQDLRFKVQELILAFDVTPQSELSLFEIKQAVKSSFAQGSEGLKISRLGRGLPTGADLRYADVQTILGALQHRENL